MTEVLIIEDEKAIREGLADYLKREGLACRTASSVKEAREMLHPLPSIILLDWMLPDGQGIDLLKQWRKEGMRIPILFLTARAELLDRVLGLELGADDYILKPFEPRELLARIHVQLRGTRQAEDVPTLSRSGISMDPKTLEVKFEGKTKELRKMEYLLLKLFLENPNRVFTRDELLNQVWGFDNFPTTRTIDTHLNQLRTKFRPELFETIRGMGYRFFCKELTV